ncbi:hypothetical protein [uncultured Phascolarctobacterium sp.]|uniref:hypothetical protein n=1 Tax=uncultured Phascolarctobacterium sp. TaxID=512296 RepID=UPI0027D989B1|nr:hypothetical protein [uncultured Phascolarctobacterium sp.]
MNTLSFRLDRFEFGADSKPSFVTRIFIDGKDFLDMIVDYEKEFLAIGNEKGAEGGFVPIYISELYNNLTKHCYNPVFDWEANIFGCVCGVTECEPFTIRVDEGRRVVVWYDFSRAFRGDWTYRNLGPYVFEKEQYDDAIARLKVWMDNDDLAMEEYCFQMVIDIADKIVNFLKKLPRDPKVSLPGSFWTSMVYFFQDEDEVYWDRYDDILDGQFYNIYFPSEDIDKDMLERYFDALDSDEFKPIDKVKNAVKRRIYNMVENEELPIEEDELEDENENDEDSNEYAHWDEDDEDRNDDLEDQIKPELVKEECLRRLKLIVLDETCISEFDKYDTVMISEPPKGALYGLETEDKENIAKLEGINHCKVYLIVRSFTNLGTMDSFLFVNNRQSEWEHLKEQLKEGYAQAYVINHDIYGVDYGTIGLQMASGGAPIRKF